MNRSDIIALHNLVNKDDPDTYVAAGKELLKLQGVNIPIDPATAQALLQVLFHSFLDSGQYIEAALLAWGDVKFNPEPPEVQRIWTAMLTHYKLLILGAGALGKTYSGMALRLLQWSEDPESTNSKLISTTLGHAKNNAWGTLSGFHEDSIIDLPGKPYSNSVSLRPNNRQSAIGMIAIPEGEDGKGRMQGFHPLPRVKPHHKFGKLTRVAAFIDEAEKVPEGLWVGVDNILTAQTKEGSVSVVGVTNPDDITSSFAQRAEPKDGWDSIDPDEDFEWISGLGWKVIRLDAKFSENVKMKQAIYPGLQTYEGYMELARLGEGNARYWTFARGFYPQLNIEYNIIPPGFLIGSRAVYNFVSMPENVASLDPAFAPGGDQAILTVGRFGMADSIIGGEMFPEPKMVLQIEQQFPLKKGNTVVMADEIMTLLRGLKVKPDNFVMDKSGNGWGLYDTLRIKYGRIMGLQWAEASTDRKILQEDSGKASDKYKLIVTEMWFSFSRWLEYDHVKFAPMLETHALFAELTARKYVMSGKLYKTEDKETYKRHSGGKSPDRADSTIMLVHLVRMRMNERPSLFPPLDPKRKEAEWIKSKPTPADSNALKFIDFR